MTEEKNKTRSKKYEIEIPMEGTIEIEENEVKEKKEHPIIRKVLISIAVLILIFLVYSFIICPNLLTIKEYKVSSPNLPESFHGIKIVQFSDVHYGTKVNKKQLTKIVNKINELNPDIVVFTGDLIDKNIITTEDIQKEVTDCLKEINVTLYKYAVIGNEDEQETYTKIMTEANFKVLNDEAVLLYYKENNPIVITGFSNIDSHPNYSILNNEIDGVDTSNLYNIVLFHESNAIDSIIDFDPELVLSSGTLGGKMKLFKPLFLPSNADKYYEDYYKINNTDYYISNGVGTTGVNLRFNNNPSISLYRLYKEEN